MENTIITIFVLCLDVIAITGVIAGLLWWYISKNVLKDLEKEKMKKYPLIHILLIVKAISTLVDEVFDPNIQYFQDGTNRQKKAMLLIRIWELDEILIEPGVEEYKRNNVKKAMSGRFEERIGNEDERNKFN